MGKNLNEFVRGLATDVKSLAKDTLFAIGVFLCVFALLIF
jgi:hypothetical protein